MTTTASIKTPCALIGVGEIGGVLARGLLRSGRPVYPVTRDMPLAETLEAMPELAAVIVAVGEKDLQPTLKQIPPRFHDRLVLIQNELLPRDWQVHDIKTPTVASIWFEKKPGRPVKVLIPTPVLGPHRDIIIDALTAVGIDARPVDTAEDMLRELVVKNVYILTTNIAGLVVGGTVESLWRHNQALAREVAGEVIAIQEKLTGKTFDTEDLIEGMLAGFHGDPDHQCMGRSAPARLKRALQIADELDCDTPKLHQIAAETQIS